MTTSESEQGSVDASPVVRVLDQAGRVVGAGCLVGPDLVATCAQVVALACDHAPVGDTDPGPVTLQFPIPPRDVPRLRESADDLTAFHLASVHRWVGKSADGTADIALLRLPGAAPPGVRMPPVRRLSGPAERRFRVVGFPDGLTDGVWTTGRIGAADGPGLAGLATDDTEPALTPGFSGTPVWDVGRQAVVGLAVVRPEATSPAARLLPIEHVLEVDPETLPCPYQGLQHFDEEHAPYFHGRDASVRQVLERLRHTRFVVMAGSSGTGKSSLLRAGVVPALRRQGDTVGIYRVSITGEPAVQFLAAMATVTDPVSDALPDGATVVVLDQFEELATARPDLAVQFIGLLVARAENAPRLRFVITLRWESLEHLLSPELNTALGAGTVFLPAMRRSELRAAILGPAVHPPGLAFEPGLVDTILDTAGSEPGQLPHLEALLRLLWHERDGGLLTRAAYEAVGGVAGAVGRQADEAIAHLTEGQLSDVRRLFGRLVTVERDRGEFIRRARKLSDFPAPERALLDGLTAARLLVVGADGDGTTTVELAHQALVDYWPELRKWLADDRRFIAWQATADEQRLRWVAAAEDAGDLLRGAALDAALEWQRRRTAEIPPPLAEFIGRSHARRHRDRRRLRLTVALLTVLLILAVSLGAVAVSRGNRLSDQLALANAGSLGRAALASAINDPATATQLALRAYRSDPRNPDARAALLDRYAAQRSVAAVYPHVTGGAPIVRVRQSDDGQVALADAVDRSSVLAGLAGDRPPNVWTPATTTRTSVLSRDGRLAVSADHDGVYRLWNVPEQSEQTLVETQRWRIDAQPIGAGFSPDSHRLALITEEGWSAGEKLHVWDVSGAEPVELWTAALPYRSLGAANVWVTDDGGTVKVRNRDIGQTTFDVWTQGKPEATRRVLGEGVLIGPEAQELYRCAGSGWVPDNPAQLAVYDSVTGKQTRLLTLPASATCTSVAFTADGGHLLVDGTVLAPKPVAAASVVSLATGRTFDVVLPAPPGNLPLGTTSGDSPTTDPMITARDEPDGSLTVLVARGDSLYRMRGRPDWIGPNPSVHAGARLSDDGRYLVAFDPGNAIEVRDAVTGVRTAAMKADPAETADTNFNLGDVAGDDLIHLYRDENGPDVHFSVWSLPGLQHEANYTLPRSSETGPPASAYVEKTSDRIYALVGSGRILSVFDRRSHQEIGRPVRVGPPVTTVRHPGGVLVLDPGDPDRLITTSTDGRTVVWSVSGGHEIATLPVDPLPGSGRAMVFDAPRHRVLAIDAGHLLQTIDATTWQLSRPGVPVAGMDEIVGVTPDGDIALRSHAGLKADAAVRLWDPSTGSPTGTLWLPGGAEPVRLLDGPTLTVDGTDAMPAEYAMSAAAWFTALCATDARPLTDREADLLPAGAPEDPCRRD